MFGARVSGGNYELMTEASAAQLMVKEEVGSGRIDDGGSGGGGGDEEGRRKKECE